MSDIEVEGQEPNVAPVTTSEEVATEVKISEPVKVEKVDSIESEVAEEKADINTEEEKVDAEAKEPKADSESKQEPTDAKAESTVKQEATEGKADSDVKQEQKGDLVKKERTYEEGDLKGVLKTSAQVDPEKKSNSKYDASVLPPSEEPGAIRAQVEFYMGDSNLPGDRFLWAATEGTENKGVPISKIHSFKRMQRFQPYSLIVSALRESKFLVVEGEEGQETVRRKIAYDPNAPRTKVEARSVYIKGFGDEEPSSQFDIEAFMTPYGPLNAVRLRRTDEKLFKGSVFVEFADEKTAEAFLAIEPKPLWQGKHKLAIKSKAQYISEKSEEIRNGTINPAQFKGGRGGRGGNRGRGGRGNFKGRDGDRDPDDWKKRRDDDKASGFKGRGRGGKNDHRGGKNDHKGGKNDHKGGNRRGRDNRGRDNRGPRGNDRNRERNGKDGAKNGDDKNKDDKETKVETSEAKTEAVTASPPNEKKRAREDDTGIEERATKKVDFKPEAKTEAVTASPPNEKKRVRDDDTGVEERAAKKIDLKPEVTAEA